MFVLSPASRRTVAPQFSRVIDRLFDDSLADVIGRHSSEAAVRTLDPRKPAARTPALDVSETDTSYLVAFEVPGVSRDQLKVSVEGRRVSLETLEAPAAATSPDAGTEPASGSVSTATTPSKPAASRILYSERDNNRYARTVSLPAEVDQAASQARFENGVLTLTLAKKVPTGATQLSIS